ncbi:MAG: TylF/MycF/NovP-related O-methyltransferase [Cyanobacteria bacterium J06623_5]
MVSLTKTIKSVAQTFGLDIVRHSRDFSEKNLDIFGKVEPYTMTSLERVNALVDAVHYVVNHNIEGAMVECGVWKGGSSMAMAYALQAVGNRERELYLYDTFAGMSAPSDEDVSIHGQDAKQKFSAVKLAEDESDWCLSPLDEVKENLNRTGYPANKVHYVQGKVEDTIPGTIPDEIAILRLDTDWYESTKHEMEHLFPRLKPSGVLILDDYGHWEGARKAVDEYIANNNVRILLNRIDSSGRIAIKTA